MSPSGLRTLALAVAIGVPATRSPIRAQVSTGVIPGVEVLLSDSLHLIRGKRVGLLTNHSGRDRKGTSTIDLLFKAPGVKLTALFAAEHGIRGVARAGERIGTTVDSATGITVYSLYGETPIPTKEMLDQIDVLVYDTSPAATARYWYGRPALPAATPCCRPYRWR